jgi:predicted nucleic acid-binding protein
LSLAISGQADIVVTGGNDLLSLHPFRGVPIVTPGIFLIELGRKRDE